MPAPRHLITIADDFGLTPSVNQAIDQAARHGILRGASLMVAAPYASEAAALARQNPNLKIGLHLVVIEGPAVLPPSQIPNLVDASGQFPSHQLALGLKYAFSRAAITQLAAEIRAQYEKFASFDLPLDHVNAHKHMHLHPVVAHLAIKIGREFGLRAMRVPYEPGATTLPGQALATWTRLLRAQIRRAGLLANDRVLGLHQSGRLTPRLVQSMIDKIPEGITELYFHPATETDETLARLMPDYQHVAEFQALMQAKIPPGVTLTNYSALC